MGKTVTEYQIDEDVKRAVLPALQDVTSRYGRGEFERVADQGAVRQALADKTAFQRSVLNQNQFAPQQQLAQQTLQEGLGVENLLNQLRATEGQVKGAQQGALGSARGNRASEAALVDRALDLQQADLTARQGAAQTLSDTGSARLSQQQQALQGILGGAEAGRGLTQEQLDAGITGAERFFGLLAGAPQGHTQIAPKQGGK